MSMAATRRWPGATVRRAWASRTRGMTDTRHISRADRWRWRSADGAARGATDRRNIGASLRARASISQSPADDSAVAVVEPIELRAPVERECRATRALAEPPASRD